MFDVNLDIIVGLEVVVDVCKERCIVKGVKPGPGGESLIIVKAIELQSFDIALDDVFKLD